MDRFAFLKATARNRLELQHSLLRLQLFSSIGFEALRRLALPNPTQVGTALQAVRRNCVFPLNDLRQNESDVLEKRPYLLFHSLWTSTMGRFAFLQGACAARLAEIAADIGAALRALANAKIHSNATHPSISTVS